MDRLKKQLSDLTEEHKKCSFNNINNGSLGNSDEMTGLLERVSELEELIGGADKHFEKEIERLRNEMEADFEGKLSLEREGEEASKREMVKLIEKLKCQLKVDRSESK